MECIDPVHKERKLWLQHAYVIRSCIVPEQEFKNVKLESIEETSTKFYELYERLFGPYNCTYNTHVIGSHLIEIRYRGPLTETSAFGFESFYSEIRNSFTPGTQSTLKQIFKKVLIKRYLGHHCCQTSIRYSDKESAMANDTLIYCYQDGTHKMYKIIENNEDHVMCNRQGKYKCTFKEMPNIDWASVGVYTQGPTSDRIKKIMKKNICGKVIKVKQFLITCPNNVLREK